MYTSPYSKRNTGYGTASPSASGTTNNKSKNKKVPDGPIHDFWTVIETTPAEEWEIRTQAFLNLVAAIPTGSTYRSPPDMWYNTPATLRHLCFPLSELIKDPRSTVVKRTCESATELFAKCQSDARYLLKDIMPTILGVNAQTVQVIRSYVEQMVLETISVVPCKMAMPLWLERLKSDKSRTVRDACALYLGAGIQEWSSMEQYLSLDIYMQVGTALIRALRDPAPTVRQHAKHGLETLQRVQPAALDKLIQDLELTRDARVNKLLMKIQSGEVTDDNVSISSNSRYGGGGGGGSVSSHRSFTPRSSQMASSSSASGRRGFSATAKSPSYSMGGGRPSTTRSSANASNNAIPTRITVSGETSNTNNYASSTRASRNKFGSNNSAASSSSSRLGPPMRVAPFPAAADSPRHQTNSRPSNRRNTSNSNYNNNYNRTPNSNQSVDNDTIETFENNDLVVMSPPSEVVFQDVPVISSVNELQSQAKLRNSRRSSLLQERLERSSRNVRNNTSSLTLDLQDSTTLDDLLDGDDAGPPPVTTATNNNETKEPEHLNIARELLDAHKSHVDQIMETLKIEMDTMREFETELANSKRLHQMAEEQVLDYFEAVGLCLDQRTTAGNILRRAMDKMSKGT